MCEMHLAEKEEKKQQLTTAGAACLLAHELGLCREPRSIFCDHDNEQPLSEPSSPYFGSCHERIALSRKTFGLSAQHDNRLHTPVSDLSAMRLAARSRCSIFNGKSADNARDLHKKNLYLNLKNTPSFCECVSGFFTHIELSVSY